jgi:DNA (cytosine-5)-methyltransferase 1
MNYYNEIDPNAAQWLRNLIAFDYIAPGDVDQRSIEDVHPSDLKGYTQCHFFAGIGVWSYALRRAGWRDDRAVWTGSCPCQPFSAAGKGAGVADERHLWPAWFHLIQNGKPRGVPVLGEQVASPPGLAWFDLVHADLEGQGYAVRAADLCAPGVGAPHIRQRLYFMADTGRAGDERVRGPSEAPAAPGPNGGEAQQRQRSGPAAGPGGAPGELADTADGDGRSGSAISERLVGDADDERPQGRGVSGADCERLGADQCAARPPSPVNGFWSEADWLPCIDGKARPVEPGTFPLAHGVAARVGRLRAYGNAIVAPLAEEFIRAYMSDAQ